MSLIVDKIKEYALEEIIGERFGTYAKQIIQDRAIPDVRDGLKPVQRRILYAMYRTGNTHDKNYIKCASTVGEVLGKFHPHGDSSVYDAMIRMSQWWKQNEILVDIHGNNGSIDGDSAAAYRYTEGRLSKISGELLKDIEKETVAWSLNFDDRFLEPVVLPAKFPNLLVNGASGISAGYATNIPPHNLAEIIDATIKKIDSPNVRLETILGIVKGPDFPTGGIVEGKEGIISAFKTGRGKVVIRSKVLVKKEKGKNQIIITEIPYDVNKANLVNKIDLFRIDKKIDGLSEVRDETDRDGLRIVIDLKPSANSELILNYLYKNTDLQTSFNYNMVSIVNRRPMTLGILEMLDAYINFQKETITNRTKFDLAYFEKRFHIVEGLIKAISILDDVINSIRKSKNKIDAKKNLVKEYSFTEAQAEAIVMLQLYKLTNTDIVSLKEEAEKLTRAISGLKAILSDEEILKKVMKLELRKIKEEYGSERKTEIKDEIKEITIDSMDMVTEEDVLVVLTNEGYIKRVSLRSYNSSDGETLLKPGDYVKNIYKTTTKDTILVFTNFGNYLYLPVYEIPEAKWKELGKHVSNIILIAPNEKVVKAVMLDDDDKKVCVFTKLGIVKKVMLKDFVVNRYSKAMMAINLSDSDEVINVSLDKDELIFITNNGYSLKFNSKEISPTGTKAKGVTGINLKDDYAIYASTLSLEDEYLNIFTSFNTAKRIKLEAIEASNRAKRGKMLFKKVKSKNYKITSSFITNSKDVNLFVKGEKITELKNSELVISDLTSIGSKVTPYEKVARKSNVLDFTQKKEKDNTKQTQVSFDEFIEEFKL